MRKYILLSLILFIGSDLYSQCAYNNALYLSGAAPAAVGNSVSGPDTWGGEFNRVTGMQAGYTYEISTCADPTFDSELTIYPAGGGTAVAYDDDDCGTTGGPSKILFTPAVTGDYDILLDEYPCSDNQVDMDMTITLVSTGGPVSSLVIPVVVHVVYKNASENISNVAIQSQINVLNADFRKLNSDFSIVPAAFQGVAADMDISFCLASVDPLGNPTSGITRTSTTVPSFDNTTEPKFTNQGGHDNWDPTKYLNLWVCDLTGNLLGYATFPSDLATDPELDGVVIDYEYFGTVNASTPFDLGRTATHEIGHWLNLRHIWGDATCGDDFVNDTPTQSGPSSGCPPFPQISCGNGPNGDMFYNYMDYSNDACLVMFTAGQKQRTAAVLATSRIGLSTSNGCGMVGVNENAGSPVFDVLPNPADNYITVSMQDETKHYDVTLYDVIGKAVMTTHVENSPSVQMDLSQLEKGIYIIEAGNLQTKGVKKIIVQ